jgi:type II secretory pathway pseudopilin PulG
MNAFASTPPPPAAKFKGRAFTLVELLVLIALVGLGAAMLIPALGRASPNVKAWQCRNNLRQWATALRAYASDNLDGLPRDGMDSSGVWPGSGGGHANAVGWFNLLPQYLRERTLNDYFNDPGSDRMLKLPFPGGKGRIWHCSSASMTAADVAMVAGGGAEGFFSYEMSIDLKKQLPDFNMVYPFMPKLAAFMKPSATVFLFDCAFNPRTEVVNGTPQYNSVNPANRWRSFSGRHNKSGTLAFLDGQAKAYSALYVTNGATTYEPRKPDIIWNAPYRLQYP